ncbi:MAG: hypothetical protein K5893_13080 [Prevotella sp.]|nr:hypothetical protein [Prevotella sp.]
MRKKTLVAMVAIVLGLVACGEKKAPAGPSENAPAGEQVEATSDAEALAPGDGVLEGMAKNARAQSFEVEVTGNKANIHDFARIFCRQFRDFEPNAHMLSYLGNPSQANQQTEAYSIHESMSSGYISCTLPVQFDVKTVICYWNRDDGHQLVGVWMRQTSESETASNGYAFYDFDPETKQMKPDGAVNEAMAQAISSVKAEDYWIDLPEQGKDITITYYNEGEEEPVEKVMKWNGNGFNEPK